MDLFTNTLSASMSKSLDGLWTRMEVTSDNIANFETPNYKRKVVSFEEQLSFAINNNDSKADRVDDIRSTFATTREEVNERYRMDGNGVDLEEENLEMARATYQYMYAQRVLNDHYTRLKTAINIE